LAKQNKDFQKQIEEMKSKGPRFVEVSRDGEKCSNVECIMLLEAKQKLEVANEEMWSQIELLMVERGEKGVSEMATSWIEEM